MKAILMLAALTLIPTGFADQLPVGCAGTTTAEPSAKPPMMTCTVSGSISLDHQSAVNGFNRVKR